MQCNRKFYKRSVEPEVTGHVTVRYEYSGVTRVQLDIRNPKEKSSLLVNLSREEALFIAMEILGIVHRQDADRKELP